MKIRLVGRVFKSWMFSLQMDGGWILTVAQSAWACVYTPAYFSKQIIHISKEIIFSWKIIYWHKLSAFNVSISSVETTTQRWRFLLFSTFFSFILIPFFSSLLCLTFTSLRSRLPLIRFGVASLCSPVGHEETLIEIRWFTSPSTTANFSLNFQTALLSDDDSRHMAAAFVWLTSVECPRQVSVVSHSKPVFGWCKKANDVGWCNAGAVQEKTNKSKAVRISVSMCHEIALEQANRVVKERTRREKKWAADGSRYDESGWATTSAEETAPLCCGNWPANET